MQGPGQAVTSSDLPAPAVFVLSSHSTIKDAAALKGELEKLIDVPEVTIDVGSVERIDTTVMQLICAFVRDRVQRERRVSWRGASASWRDAVRLLGTGELLGWAAEGAAG